MQRLRAWADSTGCAVHVDGARIWNAHVATGVPLAVAALTSPWVALAALTSALAVRPIRVVSGGARGPALIPALKQTGILLLAHGLALGALLAWA